MRHPVDAQGRCNVSNIFFFVYDSQLRSVKCLVKCLDECPWTGGHFVPPQCKSRPPPVCSKLPARLQLATQPLSVLASRPIWPRLVRLLRLHAPSTPRVALAAEPTPRIPASPCRGTTCSAEPSAEVFRVGAETSRCVTCAGHARFVSRVRLQDTRLWAKDGSSLFTVRSDNWCVVVSSRGVFLRVPVANVSGTAERACWAARRRSIALHHALARRSAVKRRYA